MTIVLYLTPLFFYQVLLERQNIQELKKQHKIELQKEISKRLIVEQRIDLSKKLLPESITQAIISVESSGNPKAYNQFTGAVGLMQLTPIIYKKVCGLSKQEAFEITKNIACGSLFFKHLLTKYNNNLERSLVFYNNGYVVTHPEYYDKVISKIPKKQLDKIKNLLHN